MAAAHWRAAGVASFLREKVGRAPQYQSALKHRLGVNIGDFVLVEGV
jgi:hypothetical protein